MCTSSVDKTSEVAFPFPFSLTVLHFPVKGRENRNLFHVLSTVRLGGTSFSSKMS